MATRKRRPGGGRKSQGPIRNKSENFSTRISPDTRAALELEARKTGQSISQAAEGLLRIGLRERKRERGNRPLRALLFLIEQLAESASSSRVFVHLSQTDEDKAVADRKANSWRTDRFRFEAFKIAVTSLLAFIAPSGPVCSPWEDEGPEYERIATELGIQAIFDEIKDSFSTPEKFGSSLFSSLLMQIHRKDDFSDSERELMGRWPEFDDMIKSQRYGIFDARKDLDLPSKHGWK